MGISYFTVCLQSVDCDCLTFSCEFDLPYGMGIRDLGLPKEESIDMQTKMENQISFLEHNKECVGG